MPREQLMNGMMGLLALLALSELAYAFWFEKKLHGFRDTVSSVALGIGQQAVNVYLSGSFLALYVWIYDRHWVPSLDTRVWWHWALFIVLSDLCYYAGHRAMHTLNFWVAAHIVHHQAEDFNFLSSFRQSWTAWVAIIPFFLWLALFVPIEMFVYGQLGIMFLQFLAHNGVVRRRLGPLEWVFVTPANHRVHHGINGPYLGANCGGMFVIWDRVFGTYVEEDPAIPIQMGSPVNANFYDPFEANLDYYRRLWFAMRHRRGFGKLTLWFERPQRLLAELEAKGYDAWARAEPLNRGAMSPFTRATASVALVVSAALLFWHRVGYAGHPVLLQLATGALVMTALWLLGRVLSQPIPYAFGRSHVDAR